MTRPQHNELRRNSRGASAHDTVKQTAALGGTPGGKGTPGPVPTRNQLGSISRGDSPARSHPGR